MISAQKRSNDALFGDYQKAIHVDLERKKIKSFVDGQTAAIRTSNLEVTWTLYLSLRQDSHRLLKDPISIYNFLSVFMTCLNMACHLSGTTGSKWFCLHGRKKGTNENSNKQDGW